ncbi:metastasis-associated protein MTA1-like [Mauremys reevesii]|uniref:metastasis-associated protein MTA1-like n=1 Tax=Mauremys reevesii TaxID=260615 RepID=UPI00193FC38F|nr:metastasis-associated protein MTA1-like [Mauremys reevesii]
MQLCRTVIRKPPSHTTRTIMHTTPHSHITTNGKALSAIKPSTSPVIKRQRQNWLDVPSADYFIATEETSAEAVRPLLTASVSPLGMS